MIQLFEIKKKVKKIKKDDTELLNKYTKESVKQKEEILMEFNTTENGITEGKAKELLEKDRTKCSCKK